MGVPGHGTCRRDKEGCSSHRSPAARGLTGAGSLIKHGSVIRICSPAQETLRGSDHHVLEAQSPNVRRVRCPGRSSRAPSVVLGLSGADVTQGGGHGAAGSCEDVLRKALTARSVRPPLCLSQGRPPPETRSGQGLIRRR